MENKKWFGQNNPDNTGRYGKMQRDDRERRTHCPDLDVPHRHRWALDLYLLGIAICVAGLVWLWWTGNIINGGR